MKALKLNSPSQKVGETYEYKACQYLQSKGLILVTKNWLQAKVGELDLVMVEKQPHWDVLVFIEVRARKIGRYGDAIDSITKSKQRKMIKTARHFLAQNPQYENYECRFDVIAFSEQAESLMMLNDSSMLDELRQQENDTSNQAVIRMKKPQQHLEWIQGAFVANAWS